MKNEHKKLTSENLPPACSEEERFDALRLIQTGKRIQDDLTFRVGQARLRLLENRATQEDLELLHLEKV